MRFLTRLEPTESLPVLRMQSEQGIWELGMRQMMFGVRVSLMRTQDFWYTLDYCAADDEAFLLQLYVVISLALESFSEDVDPNVISRQFPRFQFKPIKYDRCWGELYFMAYGEHLPFIQCSQCERLNYQTEDSHCPCCNHKYEHSQGSSPERKGSESQGGDRCRTSDDCVHP